MEISATIFVWPPPERKQSAVDEGMHPKENPQCALLSFFSSLEFFFLLLGLVVFVFYALLVQCDEFRGATNIMRLGLAAEMALSTEISGILQPCILSPAQGK